MTDTTTPVVDLQDPLPEASWLWRRVFVFVVTAVVLWMVWGAIDRLGTVAALQPRVGVQALLSLCKWLLGMVALMSTYYMVAPSAEQIVKVFNTAALLRSGVQMVGSQVIHGIEGRVETVKTAGVPPNVGSGGRSAPPAPLPIPTPAPAPDGPPWASHSN